MSCVCANHQHRNNQCTMKHFRGSLADFAILCTVKVSHVKVHTFHCWFALIELSLEPLPGDILVSAPRMPKTDVSDRCSSNRMCYFLRRYSGVQDSVNWPKPDVHTPSAVRERVCLLRFYQLENSRSCHQCLCEDANYRCKSQLEMFWNCRYF